MKPMGITMFTEFRRTAFALLAVALLVEPAAAVPANIGHGLMAALPSGGPLSDGAMTVAPRAFDASGDTLVDLSGTVGTPDAVILDIALWADLLEIDTGVDRRILSGSVDRSIDVWTVGSVEADGDGDPVQWH